MDTFPFLAPSQDKTEGEEEDYKFLGSQISLLVSLFLHTVEQKHNVRVSIAKKVVHMT